MYYAHKLYYVKRTIFFFSDVLLYRPGATVRLSVSEQVEDTRYLAVGAQGDGCGTHHCRGQEVREVEGRRNQNPLRVYPSISDLCDVLRHCPDNVCMSEKQTQHLVNVTR